MTTTTPDMLLVLPDVSVTAGPEWATLLNAAFTLIDSHNHSSGQGALVTPAGLNINSDLTFQQNNATNLRTARFFNNSTFTPGGSDLGILYELNNELYYRDGVGNTIQLTLNGSIDASGSISSLTIKDTAFTLEYFGDITRQMQFSLAAIPTGTLRIISVPDSGANDTFVTQAATQTLTNKTLTSPKISTIVNGSYTMTLPTADGSNGYILQTNGSGVWSFIPNPSGTQATATTLGVVKGGTVPGQVSGSAVAAGYLGETITSAANTTITNNTPKTVTSITLSAGVWCIGANGCTPGGGVSLTSAANIIIGISTTTNSLSGLTLGSNQMLGAVSANGTQGGGVSIASYVVNNSGSVTYYLVGDYQNISTTGTLNGAITATRIG